MRKDQRDIARTPHILHHARMPSRGAPRNALSPLENITRAHAVRSS